MAQTAWLLDSTRILTASEIKLVLADLQRRSLRSINSRTNLVVFRLACCCGLRASEIAGITLRDVRVNTVKPHIHVRASVAKFGRARKVPLWWDGATLADLTAWKEFRTSKDHAKEVDPFVCTRSKSASGNALHRNSVRSRFIAACRALDETRRAELTVHDGRHSFVSHALRAGRTLAEVKQAAGHSNIATTSVYLHVAVEDDGNVGNLFG